ncbi:MAG: GNAT family N-acetyltransferase [Lysobacterales bacterium]|jgi:putative acetyltransferase
MYKPSGQRDFHIRPIRPSDNAAVAAIIREVMTEFGAVGCGFSINDSEVDDMYGAYQGRGHAFYVVTIGGTVLGCAGIAPLSGGDADTCELRKMYFLPRLRGRAAGSALMRQCLHAASAAGFRYCYLETTTGMRQARRLYQRFGFADLDKPLGNTGHTGCGSWMLKTLDPACPD